MAASATIAQAGLDGGQTAVSIAVFVIIGSITVAGPVLFSVIAPDTAHGRSTRSSSSCRRTTR